MDTLYNSLFLMRHHMMGKDLLAVFGPNTYCYNDLSALVKNVVYNGYVLYWFKDIVYFTYVIRIQFVTK